jgi:hypothetical protein
MPSYITISNILRGVEYGKHGFEAGKRTVYSESEVKRMKKPTLVILFRFHLESPEKLNLEELCKRGILKAAPQFIKEINNNQYSELKKGCKLDEYLAVP